MDKKVIKPRLFATNLLGDYLQKVTKCLLTIFLLLQSFLSFYSQIE
jgi:hypothetical protein